MSADIRLLRWHDRDREDYERLQSALMRVRAVAAQGRGEIVATVPSGPEEPDDIDRARALLAQRRARDAAAGPLAELFGEPGWDILLTLFIAFEEDRSMRPTAIAAAIGLRLAVARRWLTVLRSRGLIWSASEEGKELPATAEVSLTSAGITLALGGIARA